MSVSSILETVVATMAETAVAQEQYFGDLDSVAGDGDFGYSLARGFETVLEGWDGLDRTSDSSFLRSVASLIAARMGGTSGPIWGTAFLRASMVLAPQDGDSMSDQGRAVAALRASVQGITDRGKAQVGDKTLLDALVPAVDELENALSQGAGVTESIGRMAQAAQQGAESTVEMKAMRGRASYVGDRSIGSIDPGAAALALMLQQVAVRLTPDQ